MPTKRKRGPIVNRQVLAMRAKGYCTVKEAADLGGVSVIRLYTLLDEGRIAGIRVGGRRYVNKASAEAHFKPRLDARS